jgi:hypothetical protein
MRELCTALRSHQVIASITHLSHLTVVTLLVDQVAISDRRSNNDHYCSLSYLLSFFICSNGLRPNESNESEYKASIIVVGSRSLQRFIIVGGCFHRCSMFCSIIDDMGDDCRKALCESPDHKESILIFILHSFDSIVVVIIIVIAISIIWQKE